MQKFTFLILLIFSIICCALTGLCFALAILYFLITGGNYSQSFIEQDGGIVMACGYIFDWENWFWILFELLVAPLFIFLAAFRTAQISYRRLLQLKN